MGSEWCRRAGPPPWTLVGLFLALMLEAGSSSTGGTPTAPSTSASLPLYTLQVDVREPDWTQSNTGLPLPFQFAFARRLDRFVIGFAISGEERRVNPSPDQLAAILDHLDHDTSPSTPPFHSLAVRCNADDGTLLLDVRCPDSVIPSWLSLWDELLRLLLFYTGAEYDHLDTDLSSPDQYPSNVLTFHAVLWERVLAHVQLPTDAQFAVAHLIRTFPFTDSDRNHFRSLLYSCGIDVDRVFIESLSSSFIIIDDELNPNSIEAHAHTDFVERLAAHILPSEPNPSPPPVSPPSLRQLTCADLFERLDPDLFRELVRRVLSGPAARLVPALITALTDRLASLQVTPSPSELPLELRTFLDRFGASDTMAQWRRRVLARLAQHPFRRTFDEVCCRPDLIVIVPINDDDETQSERRVRYQIETMMMRETKRCILSPGSIIVLNPISIPTMELLEQTPIDEWLPLFSDAQQSELGADYQSYYQILFYQRPTVVIHSLSTPLREDLSRMLRDPLNVPYWLLGELVRSPKSVLPSITGGLWTYTLPPGTPTDLDNVPSSVVVLFWAHVLDQTLPAAGRTLPALVAHLLEYLNQTLQSNQLPDALVRNLANSLLAPLERLVSDGVPAPSSSSRVDPATDRALDLLRAISGSVWPVVYAALSPSLYRDADSVLGSLRNGLAFQVQLRCPQDMVHVRIEPIGGDPEPVVTLYPDLDPVEVPPLAQPWLPHLVPPTVMRLRPLLLLFRMMRQMPPEMIAINGTPNTVFGLRATLMMIEGYFQRHLAADSQVRTYQRGLRRLVQELLPYVDAQFRLQTLMTESSRIAARLCGQLVVERVRRLFRGVSDSDAAHRLDHVLQQMESRPITVAALMHQLRYAVLNRAANALTQFLSYWDAVHQVPDDQSPESGKRPRLR